MPLRNRISMLVAGAILAAVVRTHASAQEDPAKYPTRPIHIIVGFAPGGGNDIIARVFGQKLSESLGQPVIVENKPGGGAIVATEYVAKSAPDGYTLLMSASGISINPAVYAKLPYDAIKDFVAVSELGSFPLIMPCLMSAILDGTITTNSGLSVSVSFTSLPSRFLTT